MLHIIISTRSNESLLSFFFNVLFVGIGNEAMHSKTQYMGTC